MIVKSASRLSRNTQEAIEIVREFKGLGIEVEFETENISTQDQEQDFELSIRMDEYGDLIINSMLTNEKYIGNICLGKTYTGEYPNNK